MLNVIENVSRVNLKANGKINCWKWFLLTGKKLAGNPELTQKVRDYTKEKLELEY